MRLPSVSLFWRTFFLIVLFLVVAMLAWAQSVRVFEREPRAQAIAQQIVSVVNVTRSALLYSDANVRGQLLIELADNEGLRIAPKEPTDQVRVLPNESLVQLVRARVHNALGADTQLATEVNGRKGTWVSFTIQGDAYWVVIERDLLAPRTGKRWLRWALASLLLSLLAAVAITRALNRPLAQLIESARAIGAGRSPHPLPESGPTEIRTVNRSFNRMVSDLAQIEQDRAVVLAGISHDLRTPLTRLRLEIEMSTLSGASRQGMIDDIEQMDSVIRQFLDYARGTKDSTFERVDVQKLMALAIERNRLTTHTQIELKTEIAPNLYIHGNPTELSRALDNLLTNALNYGCSADGSLALSVRAYTRTVNHRSEVVIEIADQGPGIAADQIERVVRPFERGDAARAGPAGAGLGLAIVKRIVQKHHGDIQVCANAPQGLRVHMSLPSYDLER